MLAIMFAPYMLFEDEEPCTSTEGMNLYKRTVLGPTEHFVEEIRNMDVYGEQRDDSMKMVLVSDAKKSNAQVKYERDVRDRITKGPEYYGRKRARDPTFRSKNVKPVPHPMCIDCGKQGFHYTFCRQSDIAS